MCEIARVIWVTNHRERAAKASFVVLARSPGASGIAIILRDGGSAAALMPGGGSKSIRRHRTDVRPLGKTQLILASPESHRRRDIDLNICRHATTRGVRARSSGREAATSATEQVSWWSS